MSTQFTRAEMITQVIAQRELQLLTITEQWNSARLSPDGAEEIRLFREMLRIQREIKRLKELKRERDV